MEDFELTGLPSVDALYGILGTREKQSLSPVLHNLAYQTLGLSAHYISFNTHSFDFFREKILRKGTFNGQTIPLRGLTVTAPFKETALAFADFHDLEAVAAGGANLLIRRGANWYAGSSDFSGLMALLKSRGIQMAGRTAAVMGDGGAGRAAVVGLSKARAWVTLVHRDHIKGLDTAKRLGVRFLPWDAFKPERFDMIIQATPAGIDGGEPPFDPERVSPNTLVVEFGYGKGYSALVKRLRSRGMRVISGFGILRAQTEEQFRMMTGREFPAKVWRDPRLLEEIESIMG